jgi:hypothetical protein
MEHIMIWVNLTAGFTAALVYSLWALRYAHQHQHTLAFLHIAAAAVSAALGIIYSVFVGEPSRITEIGPTVMRPLVAAILLLPAAARFVELLHEQRREALSRHLARALHERMDM